MSGEPKAPWHILEASSVPAIEFAVALRRLVPVVGWVPQMSWLGLGGGYSPTEFTGVPPVPAFRFPLQRGYGHPALTKLLGTGNRIRKMLSRESPKPEASPLVCTTPFFAQAAEVWPGPVVYYSLDFTCAYEGLDGQLVLELERKLCRVAQLVCPVSERIADYLTKQAGCSRSKIKVLPNAARATNLRATPHDTADPLPADASDLQRPVVGVIGNMADNLDWHLLHEAILARTGFSWLFVGPTSMKIRDAFQSRMRAAVMSMGGRVRFLGAKPYGELHKYARSIDVAVMPYRQKEPTYSGSATRFYEHLAAGRPILSTRGVAELEVKEPLLDLFDGPQELAHKLSALAQVSFVDSLAGARCQQSREETWDRRAEAMFSGLDLIRANPEPPTVEESAATRRA